MGVCLYVDLVYYARMEPLRKQLRNLTIPIFMEIALVMLVGFVDVLMLSQYGEKGMGDHAVAAVGFVNQFIGLVFLIYQFVSQGMAIVCAQYYGAGERRRLVQIVGLALGLNAALGLAVSAALCVFPAEILRLLQLNEDLLPQGVTYLRITGMLSFFQALAFTFSASLRSVDRVRAVMYVTVAANILNAAGNYLLIFGHFGCPELGVAGAAWATAGSRAISMVLLAVVHFRTHIPSFPLAWFRPFPWRELRNLFAIGLPSMGEEASYCFSQLVISCFVNQISTEALTTRTYCANSIMFVYLFCCSITQGGDIIVGHLVGRNRYTPAYLMGNFFLGRSMVVTLSCSAVLALCGPWLFGLLTENAEIIRMGCIILWIDSILEVGRVRNIFACQTLRCTGDAVYPLVVGIIFQWGVAVGIAWLFAFPCGWGLIGAWIAFALDENLRGIVLMRRWHTKGWVGKNLA